SPIEIGDSIYKRESKKKISELGLKKSSAKILPPGTILYTSRAGIGKTAILAKSGSTNQGFQSIIPLEDVLDSYFIYSRTEELRIYGEKYGSGSTFNEISGKQLEKMPIKIPTIEEQKYISQFVKHLDYIVTLHQRRNNILEELKKAYLKEMFVDTVNSVPNLRFKDFKEVWEQRKLYDLVNRVSGNDGRMDLPTLTISASKGWLSQKERFSGNIAGKEQKNYTLLSKNDLSYNKGNSKLAKYGVVYKLDSYHEALVPKVYHSFRTNEKTNPDYIEYMFATKRPDKELSKLITSEARMDGLLNINYDDFSNIKIIIPILEEQEKISKLMRNIDYLLALHQRKINNLEKLKSSYLQKLFL